jgi:hypothetical protein
MRTWAALSVLCLGSAAAAAGGITSAYTKFDLDQCKVVAPGDEFIYEGTWACEGYGGLGIFIAGEDARNYAAFGRDGAKHCAFRKTFAPFNTALSPIEWRIRDGKAFSAIERWSVVNDENGNSVTWLVVTALREDDSCHAHYVSGSYPDANEVARRAADELAPGFDCESGIPAFDSNVGPPPIDLTSCRERPA